MSITLYIGKVQVNGYTSSKLMDTFHPSKDGLKLKKKKKKPFLLNKVKHSLTLPTHSNHTHALSYMLALGYSEQLSAGISSVLQLSALAMDFEANLVEPTVVTSHLFGIEGVYPTYYRPPERNRTVKLFGMFNQSKINHVLHAYMDTIVNMVTFDEFLINAPRNISIFHFNSNNLAKTNRLFTFPKNEVADLLAIFKRDPKMLMVDCLANTEYSGIRSLSKMVEKALNLKARGMPNDTFRVAEGFCLNHDHIYKSHELIRKIPIPRTIIFSNWGGCGLKDCAYGSKDLEREKEAMAAVPHIRHSVLTQKALEFHSKSLLHHERIHIVAKDYLKYLGFTPQDFISVHIRLERIVRYMLESKTSGTYKKCRDSALETVNKILHGSDTDSYDRHYQTSQKVLVMSDNPGSKYGTDTCSGRKCNLEEVNKLFNFFKESFSFQSFDPRVRGEVQNAGFVSLVEMHMLSMSKKLVLVGYGGFQAMLKDLFLSLGHTESDVYHVCNYGRKKRESKKRSPKHPGVEKSHNN